MKTQTTNESVTNEQAKAIRWIVIGTLVAEYGARLLPKTRGELKMRVNAVVNSSLRLQSYFIHHPNATPENKEVFKREFLKSEIVLVCEILETICGVSESDLENILQSLKDNIENVHQ